MNLLKTYWFALSATLIIWLLTGWLAGISALITVIILTVLEVTFSADNAVVNSKVIATLSKKWQTLFMTLGIVIAVFVVRFCLPIFMVMLTAHIGFGDVLNLALNQPQLYAEELTKAEPFINAFGGAFLLLIALSFFIDYQKTTHWVGFLERRLGKLGRFDGITTFIMLLASVVLYWSVPAHHDAVLIAAITAMLAHSGLQLINAMLSTTQDKKSAAPKIGWAAFAGFMYLEVLDSAFSLDGVIGSFAITNSVLLIMAGLGAGAVWVRAITAHLLRSGTLAKYLFLEHGAHWAIGFLGVIMMLKLYGITLPEWIVGSLGLVFIALAVWWSKHTTPPLARTS